MREGLYQETKLQILGGAGTRKSTTKNKKNRSMVELQAEKGTTKNKKNRFLVESRTEQGVIDIKRLHREQDKQIPGGAAIF